MTKLSRRSFILTGAVASMTATGALLIGCSVKPDTKELTREFEDQTLTSWVKISSDNTITGIVPHGEMGQGVHTALGQMLAEEIGANWDTITIEQAPATSEYANYIIPRVFLTGGKDIPADQLEATNDKFFAMAQQLNFQTTGGSMSVRFTGVSGLQVAAATARDLLLKAAGQSWGVKPSTLRAESSRIYDDTNKRSAPFAEFAEVAATLSPNLKPEMKARKDYTIMGTSVPRVDIPAKVNGTATFGIDIDIPGMKYATVKAAPVHGNTVKTIDASEALAMRGVIDVLNMEDFVAVVAEGYWQAKQAIEAVKVEFNKTESDNLNSEGIYAQYRKDMKAAPKDDKELKINSKGDTAAALQGAISIIETEYKVPFLAHTTMEPMNATAWVRDGKCDVWLGTQNPLGMRGEAAKALDMDAENITIHNQFLGGGFGRRARPDYTKQAVRISQKMNLPVKTIWSREEDVTQDYYRPATVSQFKVGVNADGMPIAWDNQFAPKMDPVEASLFAYNIPNQEQYFAKSPTHIRIGAWRSVDHSQHGFFIESMIDELAHNARQDPYEYRKILLKGNPRHLAVLNAAAKLGNWGKAMQKGTGQGISLVDSFQTIVAQVVDVDMRDGTPKVIHVACVADPGLAVNPDGFTAQMESGIIYGLTAALYGEISITDGAVDQRNFHDYEAIRMDMAPKIDVQIITSDAKIGGAGEPATPPIAPALTNAIFAATGKRIRSLPVKNIDFKAAS